ncbi:cadherin domain-containing protein [uncultured Marinobacter sp.]|uniref:cadherin domain-containing protein n=1 Tax=uncultured Marinobacter sp. TaxID=187379 RepID=UPI0026287DF8|nr:cadherin domain-containing protein [uncultured Marinobacter sp.]
MSALQLRIVTSAQIIETHALDAFLSLPVETNATYAIVDADTQEPVSNLVLKKKDDALVIEIDDEPVAQLEQFYDADQGAVFEVSEAGNIKQVTAADPVVEGSDIVWQAADSSDLDPVAVFLSGGLIAQSSHGGGHDEDTPEVNTVVGQVVAGPVLPGNDLKVAVYQSDGITELGHSPVDAEGRFSVAVGSYRGVVIAQAINTGASKDHLDEATNAPANLNAELFAAGAITEANSTLTLNLNALTTIAYHKALEAAGGDPLQADDVAAINKAIANAFGLSDLHNLPVVTVNGDTSFDTSDGISESEAYGILLAAFSGADLDNGGDSQATIDALVAGIDLSGGVAALSPAAEAILLIGAIVAGQTGDAVADLFGKGTGVTGVTAENAGSVKDALASLPKSSSDTPEEIQAIVDALNVVRGAAGGGTPPTLEDFETLGITGITPETLKAMQEAVGGTPDDGSEVDTLAGLQAVIDSVDVTPPGILSVSVEDGTWKVGDQVEITITADNGETGLTLSKGRFNGQELTGFRDNGDGTYTAIYTVVEGDSNVADTEAVATELTLADAAGNTSSELTSVTLNGESIDATAPSFISSNIATSIDENSVTDQVVYTAWATDAGGDVTYSLKESGDHASFSINSSNGSVILTGDPDYETKANYSFTVVATDAAGNASEQAVALDVNNLDEVAPTITSAATATALDENSGAGQVVYIVTSTDTGDISGGVSYSLKAGSDAALSIDAQTGAVTLTADPDHEAQSSYSFTVIATDAAGNASEQAVTLDINNLDEVAPTITSAATATALDENSGAGQVVYTVTSTDTGDISGGVSYSLKAGSDAALSIDAQTGAVTLLADPDHETKANYSFTVIATDAAGNASEQPVTLNVNDLDESKPTITSGDTAIAIDENSGAGQVIYTATATDTADVDDATDTSAALTYSLSGADAGLLSIDSSTGAVTLTADPDHETKVNYSFTVIATDAAGNSSAPTAVTLNVNDIDDSNPIITSGDTAIAIDENSGAGQVIYTVTATDTADSDDATDTSADLTYSLSGADAGLLSIDSGTGAVTLTADPDHETKANYSFTVVATDAAGNASEQAVTLDINNLDEVAPTITSAATATALDENSGAGQVVYTVTSTDTGDISGGVSYSLKAGSDAALSIDAQTGAVTLLADPDHETKANYSFTVIATDAAGNASEQPVTLNVNDLDESKPTITSGDTAIAIDENSGAGQVIYTATATDTADVDDATDTSAALTYSLSGADAGLLSIDSDTGAVTLTADPDHETKVNYSFTVIATDTGGNTDTQAVSLDINDLDDSNPIITSGDTAIAIDENSGAGQTIYTVTATDTADVDDATDTSAALTYSLSGADASLLSIDSNSGEVKLIANPDYETRRKYNFDVIAKDVAGNTDTQAVTLNINDLDDTPPRVNSVTITSATGIQNKTLNTGDVVSVTVTMSEATTVSGTPQLALNIGGTIVQADYASGSGSNKLVFTYTITNETDTNGISINHSSLTLNNGSLVDAAGNNAVLTMYNQKDNPNYLVDTTAPSIIPPDTMKQLGSGWHPLASATDSDGGYVITWASGGDILVQQFNADGTRPPTVRLNAGLSSDRPQATAVGTDGAYVVTWHGKDSDGDYSIFVQQFNADGTTIGDAPVQLEATGNQDGLDKHPQITALGSDGAYVVTWFGEVADQANHYIFVQQFNADGTINGHTPIQLETTGGGTELINPQIAAVGSEGAYVVTWEGRPDFWSNIMVQQFSAEGTTNGPLAQLSAAGALDNHNFTPQITAVGSDGGYVVTWEGNHDDVYSTYVQQFNANGTTTGYAQVKLGNNLQYAANQAPQITALGSEGAYVVTWEGRDEEGPGKSIYVQQFNANGTISGGAPVELKATSNGNDTDPQITAVGSEGAYVVTWRGDDVVFVQHFNADGTTAGYEPVTLGDYDQHNTPTPQISEIGSDGAYVVTWNGSRYISVQQFNPDGTKDSFTVAKVDETTLGITTATVQSSEAGMAYLVKDSVVVNSLADITGADDNQWNSATITTANTNTAVTSAGLVDGNYRLYTADAAGNLSEPTPVIMTIDTAAPTLSASSPVDGATDVALDSDITLTFNEAIALGASGTVTVTNGTDAHVIDVSNHNGQLSVVGNTLTINPTADLAAEESTYYVQVSNGAITDTAGKPFAGIADSTTVDFTTAAAPTSDTSIVVFDMVNGVSSGHSGREFQADVAYTIYLRVDSDSATLHNVPQGGAHVDASWGQWTGGANLGADDRIVLVGDGAPVIGRSGVQVLGMHAVGLSLSFSTGSASAVYMSGFRGMTRATLARSENQQLWSGSWGVNPNADNAFASVYQTAMATGILTSQGLV